MEGIGWFIVIGLAVIILIYYKIIKPRKTQEIDICVECNSPIESGEPVARDKTTNEVYHLQHWWDKVRIEFFEDLHSCFYWKKKS